MATLSNKEQFLKMMQARGQNPSPEAVDEFVANQDKFDSTPQPQGDVVVPDPSAQNNPIAQPAATPDAGINPVLDSILNRPPQNQGFIQSLTGMPKAGMGAALGTNIGETVGSANPPQDFSTDLDTTEKAVSKAFKDTVRSPDVATKDVDQIKDEAKKAPEGVIDFGKSSAFSTEGLKEAQGRKADMQLTANLGRGFDSIISGISGRQPTNSPVFKSIDDQAEDAVKNYKDIADSQKQDPNSAVSKGFKQYMQKLGVNIKGDASAADIEKIMPFAYRQYESQIETQAKKDIADANRKSHSEDLKYKYDELKTIADLKNQSNQAANEDKKATKLEKQDTDRFDKLAKDAIAEKASSRSAFGTAARNVQSVQNAKALLDGSLNYNDLDVRQAYELGKVLDRVLSQGAPTVAGSMKLTPETAQSKVAKYMEFITNKRQKGQLGDFIKTTADTLDREESLSKKQIANTQRKVFASSRDLFERNPDKFNDIMTRNGLEPMTQWDSDSNAPDDRTPQAQSGIQVTDDMRSAAQQELDRRAKVK